MNIGTVLVVILILLLIGALPPLGLHQLGWQPAGGLGLLLLLVLVLLILGRI